MRSSGARLAGLISFILSVSLLVVLGRTVGSQASWALHDLGPTALEYVRKATGRAVAVDRLEYQRPGLLRLEGLKVGRGKDFKSGLVFSARQVELTYDPSIWKPGVWLKHLAGIQTRGAVRVVDARVWTDTPLAPRELATIGAVSTTFDLGTFAQKRSVDDLVASIGNVIVDRPRMTITRTSDNRWSFEDLLKQKREEKPVAFRSEILVQGAIVDVVDYRPGTLRAPARNRLQADATVRMAAWPTVQFTSAGSISGGTRSAFRAEGYTETKGKKGWFVEAQIDAPDAPYWFRYGAPAAVARDLNVLAGTATIRATAWGQASDPKTMPQVAAEVEVRNAALRHRSFPGTLAGLDLHAEGGLESLVFDGGGSVAGIPVRVSGEAQPGKETPFSLRVRADRVAYAVLKRLAREPAVKKLAPKLELPRDLDVPQPVALDATIAGTLAPESRAGEFDVRAAASAPAVRFQDVRAHGLRVTFAGRYRTEGADAAGSGTVSVSRAEYQGKQARQIHLDYRLKDRLVQAEGRLTALDGHVAAKGWVDLSHEKPEFYAKGTAEEIAVEQLPIPKEQKDLQDLKPSGRVSAEFVASGTAEKPVVEAFVRGTDLAAKKERVHKIEGRIRYAAEKLEILSAVLDDPRLHATVTGTATKDGAFDLDVEARGVDLKTALAGRVEAPIGGTAFVTAHVSGTAKEPRASGKLKVYQPVYQEYAADYAEAAFEAPSLREVRIHDLSLVHAPEKITANSVTLTRGEDEKAPWHVSGDLRATGLSLVRAMRLGGVTQEDARKLGLAGDVASVTFSFEGPVSEPRIGFTALATEVAVQGLDVGRVAAEGQVDLARSIVEIQSATTRSAFAATQVKGTLKYDPKAPKGQAVDRCLVDVTFKAENIRLMPLVRQYASQATSYVDFRGNLRSASGRVEGTLRKPQATLDVALSDVEMNHRSLRVDPFTLQWQPGLVTMRRLTVGVGAGEVELRTVVARLTEQLRADEILKWLGGRIDIRGLPVAVVRQLVEDSPFFRSEQLRHVHDVLSQWRTPVGGRINGYVLLDVGGAGAAPVLDPDSGVVIRTPSTAPRMVAELSIPDFQSPPLADTRPVSVTTNLEYQGGLLRLRTVDATLPDGAVLHADGTVLHDGKQDEVKLAFSVKDFDLRTLEALPLDVVRDALRKVEPVEGFLSLRGNVSGSSATPKVAFDLDVRKPVIAGVPLDEFRMRDAVVEKTSESTGTFRLASASVIKKRPNNAPEASVSVNGTVPLTWGRTPAKEPEHQVHVLIPRQSLSVLNELAADAEEFARTHPAPKSIQGEERAERVQALAAALRQVAATRGEMEGELKLGGTPSKPRNEGFIQFRDGVLSVQNLETRIEDFELRILLQGADLVIDRFGGRSSEAGFFEGSGQIVARADDRGRLVPQFDARVKLTNFAFRQRRVGTLVESLEGTQVRGILVTVDPNDRNRLDSIRITGAWPTPTVAGAVRLDDANLKVNLKEMAGPPKPPVLPVNPRLDVKLVTGNRVELINGPVKVRLDGELRAVNTLQEPMVNGKLAVSSRSIPIPGLRLRNIRGTATVSYDGRAGVQNVTPSPIYLDIAADTILRRPRSAATGEADSYDVTLTLTGYPTESDASGLQGRSGAGDATTRTGLVFHAPRSDPPLPESQIVALIRQQLPTEGIDGSGPNVERAVGTQLVNAISSSATSVVTGRIEDFLQSSLGLNLAAIDVGGPDMPLRVQLGRRLFGRFYGTVTQNVARRGGGASPLSELDRSYSIYYRLNDRLSIGLRHEDYRIHPADQPANRNVLFIGGSISF